MAPSLSKEEHYWETMDSRTVEDLLRDDAVDGDILKLLKIYSSPAFVDFRIISSDNVVIKCNKACFVIKSDFFRRLLTQNDCPSVLQTSFSIEILEHLIRFFYEDIIKSQVNFHVEPGGYRPKMLG